MIVAGAEVKISRLESIVEQIGEAVLATTETIERLAERVDTLSAQVAEQGKQMQQQSHQILAICNTVQTLTKKQDDSLAMLSQLTHTLEQITTLITAVDD
jgi:uncharacterized coiled-coil DUF342 family protein